MTTMKRLIGIGVALVVSGSCIGGPGTEDEQTSTVTSELELPPWIYEDPVPVVCQSMPASITYESWSQSTTRIWGAGRNYVFVANAETNPQRVWAIGIALDENRVAFVMSTPKSQWGQMIDELGARAGAGGNTNGGAAVFGAVIASKLPGPIPDPTPGGEPPERWVAHAQHAWNGLTEDVTLNCVP